MINAHRCETQKHFRDVHLALPTLNTEKIFALIIANIFLKVQ